MSSESGTTEDVVGVSKSKISEELEKWESMVAS